MIALITATLMLATWYGGSYVGQSHSAYWQGAFYGALPSVVTEDVHGIATNDYPLGTILRIETVETCQGIEHRRVGIGIVLDRMRHDISGQVDVWPALAEVLGFGPTYGDRDVGCLRTRVEVVRW